jgi:hypothetical protein
MAPIDFEVTGSKVKVTGALTKKAFPLNCLRMLWLTVFIFGIEVVYDSLLILGDCVKGQVTGIFTIISLSAQMLRYACPQCIDFDIFTFEACRIHNLAIHWLSNSDLAGRLSLSSKWPLLILTKWYAGVFTP